MKYLCWFVSVLSVLALARVAADGSTREGLEQRLEALAPGASEERVELFSQLAERLSEDASPEAIDVADEAARVASELEGHVRARAQLARGIVLGRLGRIDDAVSALQEGLAFADGHEEAALPLRLRLAGMLVAQAKVDEALGHLKEFAAEVDRSGTDEQRALLYNLRAVIHQTQFEIDEALADYLNALKYAEAAGDSYLLRGLHYNIGTVRWNVDDVEGARRSYERALELAEPLGPVRGDCLLLSALGQIAVADDDPERAREYYDRALALSERCGSLGLMALLHRHRSDLALAEGRPLEALEGYTKSLALSREEGNDEAVLSSLCFAAHAHLQLNEPQHALPLAREAWDIAESLNMPIATQDASEVLSNTYAMLGDFESALRFHREYVDVRSQIESEMRSAETARLEMRQERRESEREQEEAVEEIARQKLARNVSIAGAGGLLLFVVVLTLAWRQKSTMNRELVSQNDRITHTNARIATLNHDLGVALAEVKRLSGLLPICAQCKDIRDDRGYWRQVESYITDHSEARFTHSICPRCEKELFQTHGL